MRVVWTRWVFAGIVAPLVIGGCTAQNTGMNSPARTAVFFNAPLDLAPEQIASYVTAANGGNGEAGLRLAMYYGLVTRDREKELLWLRKAAHDGNATAQYNLGVAYRDDRDILDREKARIWFKAAAAQGDVDAVHALGEMEPDR
ncbi:MAG: sel1 repeat family protein [Thioalkalivibrio sp.]|nr:sel1 repeat family protein [Thioalkalivibrio sp.]